MELITRLRKELAGQGLDAGPQTIAWHLEHDHQVKVSPATVSRYLTRQGCGWRRGPVTPPTSTPQDDGIAVRCAVTRSCNSLSSASSGKLYRYPISISGFL